MKLCLEEDLLWRSHGGLDVDNTNVLPLLLQQGCQKVSSQLNINNVLLLGHLNVSYSNIQAHNLLHLELDGGLNLVNLLLHVLATAQKTWEFTGLGKTWSQKTWDLLDHVIRGKEEIVPLGKFLHKLLVLVKLLQVLYTHVVNTDTISLLTMGSVSKHAALKIWAWNGRELEGSGETLLTLRIVVLQGNLHLDGFGEVTLLSLDLISSLLDNTTLGVSEDVVHGFGHNSGVKFV
jgi:hypothetical protein